MQSLLCLVAHKIKKKISNNVFYIKKNVIITKLLIYLFGNILINCQNFTQHMMTFIVRDVTCGFQNEILSRRGMAEYVHISETIFSGELQRQGNNF